MFFAIGRESRVTVELSRPSISVTTVVFSSTGEVVSLTMTISSSSRAVEQVIRLNDSVYELYRAKGTPSMQVVFFHGFQLEDYTPAHLKTWTLEDGSVWPMTWLVEVFPEAHVLSVSYNGWVTKSGEMDLYNICENFLSDLFSAKIGDDFRCPIVLVGHSFGGLVIKELCLHVSRQIAVLGDSSKKSRLQNFLSTVGGIFFYSTPHCGIRKQALDAFGAGSPYLLKFVETLSTDAARQEYDFSELSKQYKWEIAGLGESQRIKKSGFWGLVEPQDGIVAPEATTRYGSKFYIAENTDHITITRPREKINRTFTALVELLREIFPKKLRRPQNYQKILNRRIVGMEHVLKEVKDKLDKCTTLAVVGMGGKGKTTLAMKLFNDLESQFEYTCFIEDVKYIKCSLEEAVLSNMHSRGQIVSDTERKGKLWLLEGKMLLLVLDDVASDKDLDLVRHLQDDVNVHGKSRFVATSRDAGLFNSLEHLKVYELPFLSPGVSEDLFKHYAFETGVIPRGLKVEAFDIVKKCGGLPLTLEVLGKYLRNKPLPIWKEADQALQKAEAICGLYERLWAKLRISYDGLHPAEKEMFVDCATFFYGCELSTAKTAWSAGRNKFPESRWQHLVDLALVREDLDGDQITIGIHDQLLSLGRRIGLDPGEKDHKGRRIVDNSKTALLMLPSEDYKMDDLKDIVSFKCCASESNVQSLDTSELNVQRVDARHPDSQDLNEKEVIRLNNSVYQLYHPKATPNMQVVFFHGFQLENYEIAHVATWTSEDGSVWPQTWLVEQFPEAHVLSISYEGWRTYARGGQSDLFDVHENLMRDLLAAKIGEDPRCPVTLVGHSFGALVIEALCLHVARQMNVLEDPSRKSVHKNFTESVRGIVFYSPIPERITEEARGLIAAGNSFLSEYVDTVSTGAESLVCDFSQLTEEYGWHVEVFGTSPSVSPSVSFGYNYMSADIRSILIYDPPHNPRRYSSFGWRCSNPRDDEQHSGVGWAPGDTYLCNHINVTRPRRKSETIVSTLMGLLSEINSKSTSSPPDRCVPIFTSALCKMENLQYLWLESVDIQPKTQGSSLPQTLVYLHLCNMNWSDFFSNPLPGRVAILTLRNLSGLRTLPPSFGNLSFLQMLTIESNNELESLPDSLRGLQRLKNIRIKGCRRLKELPGSFLELKSLEQIELCATYLRAIPDLKELRLLKTFVVNWALGVPFPELPRCLHVVIKEHNYNHYRRALDVFDGEFRERDSEIVGIYPIMHFLEAKLATNARLALVGRPGIGKTTLAKELFKVLGRSYSYTCFVDDVKNINGSLEDVILKQTRQKWRSQVSEKERKEGLGFLTGKLLLLVLDDVASEKDLQIVSTLLGGIHVDEDSRFIVTCVDSDLPNFEVFSVPILGPKNSNLLFNIHAYTKGDPLSRKGDTHEFVERCRGLPLVLEIIGKYLCDKPKSTWEKACLALDEAEAKCDLDEELLAKLKISYDGLDKVEQNMFLDAATVFYKCEQTVAMAAWRSRMYYHKAVKAWEGLLEKSFVKEVDGVIMKHEQLMCLGRRLAKRSGCRIWNDNAKALELISRGDYNVGHSQDILALKFCEREWANILTKEEGALSSQNLSKALAMASSPHKSVKILGSSLSRMASLECLWLEDVHIDQIDDLVLSRHLNYLHLSRVSFSNSLISRNKGGAIPEVSLPWRFTILTLRNVSGYLPTFWNNGYNLRVLTLESINNLASLPNNMHCLEILEIDCCESLTSWPKSIGPFLKKLKLRKCSLERLHIGEWEFLKNLEIDSCEPLSCLPESIGQLKRLRKFKLRGCELLQHLPDTFLRLTSLEDIELSNTYLRSVPDLQQLGSLKTLALSWDQGAKFPILPKCLEVLVTKSNYTSRITLEIVNGVFAEY